MNNIIDWQDQYGDLETGFTVARGSRHSLTKLACQASEEFTTKKLDQSVTLSLILASIITLKFEGFTNLNMF